MNKVQVIAEIKAGMKPHVTFHLFYSYARWDRGGWRPCQELEGGW